MRAAKVLAVLFGVSALTTTASALATEAVMCKAKEEKCAEGNRYAVGTKFTAALPKGTETVLESAKWRTRCKESTTAGASTSLTGGELSTLSFGACKPLQEPPGIQECYSAEVLHLPYGVAFVTGEPGNEKGVGVERMRLSNGGNGNPSFKLNCEVSGFKFWCAYAAEELDLALVGGELPEIWINKELLILSESSSKTLCATEMGWSGIYSVSAPSPLFLSGL